MNEEKITRKVGMLNNFIQSKGYGWMLEFEEANTEMSIIEELDIDLNGIFSKIKKILIPISTSIFYS
jgi:hypothetical protein